ncbi:hypothetical protein B296_00004745 [Ensete ventricosum]|uniref:Uncharacterized protein n=1 Tax=Ensete ventricosum TaxID=4639 RepID=A0A426Z4D8_ENSVE|nr:hypothetical protein B296_00004745 [Ensete ventricosum]
MHPWAAPTAVARPPSNGILESMFLRPVNGRPHGVLRCQRGRSASLSAFVSPISPYRPILIPLLTTERSGRSEARAAALSGLITNRSLATLAGLQIVFVFLVPVAMSRPMVIDRREETKDWILVPTPGNPPSPKSFLFSMHLLSFACYLGFDVTDLSEDGPDDVEGLDASAAHVANLLSTEPADSIMGAATALYSATSCAHGTYGNGKPYPVNLSSVVGLSGWLPCARYIVLS